MKKSIHSNGDSRNIGIWIRVSTEEQAQGDSPEHHLERARLVAKGNGWTVREVYNLAGQSGKAVMEHPEAKRMMKDIERGHISALVFSKLARLSRNLREVQDFGDFFRRHDADLISLSESIDTSSAGGRMFFHLLGVFAQWEREEITERVNASVITRAKMGKSINGRAPYGYHWKDRKLVPHPDEAPIRAKAFELFREHRRKGTVAKLLNAAGYRTRENNQWRDMHMWRILTDTSAKGIYYFNRTRKNQKWNGELKPENEWGKVECEPIVPVALWEEVNQIIEEQFKSWKQPGKAPTYPFSSVAHCHCGHKLYVRKGTPKYVCRKCHNKIPIVDLEKIFLSEMKDLFGTPELAAQRMEEAQAKVAEKQSLLELHQREIQKVRDTMARTHKLYLDGNISGEGFAQFYKPDEERLRQLNAELPRLQADVDLLASKQVNTEELLSEAITLQETWPTLDNDHKRRIVETFIEKMVISDEGIHVKYSARSTSEDMCKSQQQLRGLR